MGLLGCNPLFCSLPPTLFWGLLADPWTQLSKGQWKHFGPRSLLNKKRRNVYKRWRPHLCSMVTRGVGLTSGLWRARCPRERQGLLHFGYLAYGSVWHWVPPCHRKPHCPGAHVPLFPSPSLPTGYSVSCQYIGAWNVRQGEASFWDRPGFLKVSSALAVGGDSASPPWCSKGPESEGFPSRASTPASCPELLVLPQLPLPLRRGAAVVTVAAPSQQ